MTEKTATAEKDAQNSSGRADKAISKAKGEKKQTTASQNAGSGRGGRAKHSDDAIIRLNKPKIEEDAKRYSSKTNPKRPNSRSAKEFELYKDGMTVAEYVKAGGSRTGINWDEAKGYIKVEEPKSAEKETEQQKVA